MQTSGASSRNEPGPGARHLAEYGEGLGPFVFYFHTFISSFPPVVNKETLLEFGPGTYLVCLSVSCGTERRPVTPWRDQLKGPDWSFGAT